MNPAAPESYLATQVLTAPPQKLQLMLLDAAIHTCRRTQEYWRKEEIGPAGESLLQAQNILGQLLAGLDYESNSDLVKKVAGVYLFIFRSLVEAGLERNEQKLEAALNVLGTERETWRQIVEKLGGATPPDPLSGVFTPADTQVDPSPLGLSLEA
jgi:flagellar protein FliS